MTGGFPKHLRELPAVSRLFQCKRPPLSFLFVTAQVQPRVTPKQHLLAPRPFLSHCSSRRTAQPHSAEQHGPSALLKLNLCKLWSMWRAQLFLPRNNCLFCRRADIGSRPAGWGMSSCPSIRMFLLSTDILRELHSHKQLKPV